MIARSMVRYVERHEKFERPSAIDASVGRSVANGAVRFRQTTQDEARN